jgi:hypothetical protein
VTALGTISTSAVEQLGWKLRCRIVWSACPECQREKWVPLKWDGALCGKCSVRLKAQPKGAAAKKPGNIERQRGAKNHAYRGGRKQATGGYVYVLTDPSDVIAAAMTGSIPYVLEHRLVMARAIGRPLHQYEEVHHRNGRRTDNRLENLELWIKSQPAGQRASEYHCPGCRCQEQEQ